MRKSWTSLGLVAVVATLSVSSSRAQEASFELGAMRGFAVSPDNATLVVSLTAKTELVFFDTVAGKESKRVTVEFQPPQMVWGDKLLFVAQKASGIVHILEPDSGKELATGNAGGPVRNLVWVKGLCFASTTGREVYAIDPKGTSTKTAAQGTSSLPIPRAPLSARSSMGGPPPTLLTDSFAGAATKVLPKVRPKGSASQIIWITNRYYLRCASLSCPTPQLRDRSAATGSARLNCTTVR
jgi:hypothetical protein